jgi:hypothetical protein
MTTLIAKVRNSPAVPQNRNCYHNQIGFDMLVLGEQNVSPASADLPEFLVPTNGDAGRCPVMTVDKELFADTLPTYLTRFVGREREIATVLSMVRPGRLVTVCGVGGAGKTRLAIEVAKRSRARSGAMHEAREVYWVPLSAVVNPTEVAAAVATGVGLPGQLGDRPLAPVREHWPIIRHCWYWTTANTLRRNAES